MVSTSRVGQCGKKVLGLGRPVIEVAEATKNRREIVISKGNIGGRLGRHGKGEKGRKNEKN